MYELHDLSLKEEKKIDFSLIYCIRVYQVNILQDVGRKKNLKVIRFHTYSTIYGPGRV